MKSLSKIILVIVVLINNIPVSGQNYITVDHMGIPKLFNDLVTAVDSAQNGDHIYIPGGSFDLPSDLTIDKELHIFGAGHYPDSTNATGITSLSGGKIIIIKGAEFSSLSGFYLSEDIILGISPTTNPNNITITRINLHNMYLSNNTSDSIKADNIYISECIFRSSLLGRNATNVFIEKNIFNLSVAHFKDAVFKNNIFLYQGTGCVFGNGSINSCLFQNNIIFDNQPLRYYSSNSGSGPKYVQNSTFNNNIFIDNIDFPYETNVGNNNKVSFSLDSLFVSQSGNIFSYDHDYKLISTCSGINAGTDGTDIGIYGTGEPYKDGAVPVNPHIQSKTITVENNIIKVNVKVSAQKH